MSDNTELPPQTPSLDYARDVHSPPHPDKTQNFPSLPQSQQSAYISPIPPAQPQLSSPMPQQTACPEPPVFSTAQGYAAPIPQQPALSAYQQTMAQPQAYETAMPPNSYGTTGVAAPFNPVPTNTPRKKRHLGLILGILFLVATVGASAFLTILHFSASSNNKLDYPLVRPSNAWAKGSHKAWEINLNGFASLPYADGNYMITGVDQEGEFLYEGWEISGTAQPRKLWNWKVELRKNMHNPAIVSSKEKAFAHFELAEGNSYLSELDVLTGKISDEKLVEQKKGDYVSVELRQEFYVQCTQSNSNAGSHLLVGQNDVTSAFFFSSDADKPRTCSALDYNKKVLWELTAEDFPTKTAGYYALNIDTGKISRVQSDEPDTANREEPTLFIVDADTAVFEAGTEAEGLFETKAYRPSGELIGTIRIQCPKDTLYPLIFSLLDSLPLSEVESLATGETIDLREITKNNGYLDSADWVDQNGTHHPLPLGDEPFSEHFVASEDGQTISVWSNHGQVLWLYVIRQDESVVSATSSMDLQLNDRRMARPDLVLETNREAGTITAYAPKK